MFSVQVIIAVAVTIGVAVTVTIVLAVAGATFQRDPARAAKAHPLSIPPQHLAQADDTHERARVLS
jgi:hypothetical protein